MAEQWTDDRPIYLQLKDQIHSMIMDGILNEGEALPSVRKVAVEYQINPITASKAYAELVDEGLVEKRRGLGMFTRSRTKIFFGSRMAENHGKNFETWP